MHGQRGPGQPRALVLIMMDGTRNRGELATLHTSTCKHLNIAASLAASLCAWCFQLGATLCAPTHALSDGSGVSATLIGPTHVWCCQRFGLAINFGNVGLALMAVPTTTTTKPMHLLEQLRWLTKWAILLVRATWATTAGLAACRLTTSTKPRPHARC